MIKFLLIPVFLTCFFLVNAQPCSDQIVSDSVYKPSEKQKVAATLMTCDLVNGGFIQFVNTGGKLFLKLHLKDKFGFEDVGSLELRSGSKSFFVRNATLYDFKQPQPYFLVEVLINYVGTLKDDGLTSLVFNNKFEGKFTKEDTKNIRQFANCFYTLNKKK